MKTARLHHFHVFMFYTALIAYTAFVTLALFTDIIPASHWDTGWYVGLGIAGLYWLALLRWGYGQAALRGEQIAFENWFFLAGWMALGWIVALVVMMLTFPSGFGAN